MIDYEQILKDLLTAYNKKKPFIPVRTVNRDANKIIEVYKTTYRNILDFLVKELSINGELSKINQATYLSIMSQIELMLNGMESKVRTEVTNAIETEFLKGSYYHHISTTGETDLQQILISMPFAQINWSKANQLITDTMDDLLYSTSFTEKSIKRLVKDIVSKHLQLGALEGESYKTLKQNIVKDLTSKGLSKNIKANGFVGIIDKSGRKWNILNYIDVVVKTKMHQAYTEGIKEEAINTGHDLAVISHNSATDPCKHFEGMVISMTGMTKGYYTYDQLKATNLVFHPRCRHIPVPIYSLDSLHEDDVQLHKQKLQEIKNISKKIKK